jgi:hypothetical protein
LNTKITEDAGAVLARQLVHRIDPARWLFDTTGIALDGWQQNVVHDQHKRVAALAPRQGGKSFTVGCLLGHKLHLVLDLVSHEIVCSDLTKSDVEDTTALPDLLDQIDADVARFLADGAYDKDPTSVLLFERFGAAVEIIIPPLKNAVPGPTAAHDPSRRDLRIAAIRTGGRLAWQVSSCYNQRSRNYSSLRNNRIGPSLKMGKALVVQGTLGGHQIQKINNVGGRNLNGSFNDETHLAAAEVTKPARTEVCV